MKIFSKEFWCLDSLPLNLTTSHLMCVFLLSCLHQSTVYCDSYMAIIPRLHC
jgi:hypothetical protein